MDEIWLLFNPKKMVFISTYGIYSMIKLLLIGFEKYNLTEFQEIIKSFKDYFFDHRELKKYVCNSRGYHTRESGKNIILHRESTEK